MLRELIAIIRILVVALQWVGLLLLAAYLVAIDVRIGAAALVLVVAALFAWAGGEARDR